MELGPRRRRCSPPSWKDGIPPREKREGRRRLAIDRIEDVVDAFDQQRLSANRSRKEIKQLLDRVVVATWRGRSVHEISKRDVVTLVSDVERRGTPYAANKLTKVLKAFLKWCVGRGILERSPAEGSRFPARKRHGTGRLTDVELASVLKAAREIGGPFGGIVELLALTGQRREEVARMTWVEIDLGTRIWTLPGKPDEERQGTPRSSLRSGCRAPRSCSPHRTVCVQLRRSDCRSRISP